MLSEFFFKLGFIVMRLILIFSLLSLSSEISFSALMDLSSSSLFMSCKTVKIMEVITYLYSINLPFQLLREFLNTIEKISKNKKVHLLINLHEL